MPQEQTASCSQHAKVVLSVSPAHSDHAPAGRPVTSAPRQCCPCGSCPLQLSVSATPDYHTCPLVDAACLQQVGYRDEFCRENETKYWSESSVSEDFDLYIRLASNNMFGRYVM